MRLSDKEVFELASASIREGRDLVLQITPRFTPEEAVLLAKAAGKRILVALPGPFYRTFLTDGALYTLTPTDYEATDNLPVTFTDIRRLNADGMADFLKERGYGALLLPFAECASVYEYGFRASYASVGYMRACAGRFQITALCSEFRDRKNLLRTLGIDDCLAMKAPSDLRVEAIRLSTEKGRDDKLAAICRKTPFVKTAVVCLTRRHAENVRRALERRGVNSALIHGGRTPEQNADAANSFERNETNVLVTTKHGIPSAPFLPVERTVCCGLPTSVSHAVRMTALSDADKLTCVYTEEDVRLVEKLLPGAKEAMEIGEDDFIPKRVGNFRRFCEEYVPQERDRTVRQEPGD